MSNEDAAPTDAFRVGAYRTGFTWPLPVTGDFDGGGFSSMGFYDPRTQEFHLYAALSGAERIVSCGAVAGVPFDGDGADVLGVFDVANDTFLIFDSFAADTAATVVRVSPVNWVRAPIAGRWRSTDSRPPEVGYPYDDIEPAAVGVDPSGLTAAAAALSSMPNQRSLLVSKGAGLVHESCFHGNSGSIADWYLGDDWVGAAISAPMDTDPGAAFSYSTGNTHLGSAILTRAAGVGTDVLARDSILAPLGIVAERWDRDPSGTPVGGAEVTMRPRDMARFGQLFLEEGSPDGARILTTAVVEAIRNEWVPASEIDGDLRYGAWWWIRSFGASDAYFAWGYGGQFIFVFPTLDAVVVVTSRSDVDGETSGRVSYEVFSVITDYIVPAL